MDRATIKTTAALLIATCLAAAALVLAGTPQAYAADVMVAAKANMPMGTVDVVEGNSGADASGESASYSKTVTLTGATADDPGIVHFDTEATSVYGYIVQITVKCGGETWVIGSCKNNNATADFYDEAAGSLSGQSALSIQSLESEADFRYAPGKSYKHGASFVLSGITSNITIDVEYDWTDQQTLTFYYNHEGSDIEPEKYYLHYGETLRTPPEFAAPEGYTFLGWASSPNGQPVEWDANALMGLENLSFYAIWQKSSEPTPPESEGEIVPPSDDQGNGNDSGENDSNKDGADEQGSPSSEDGTPALADTGDNTTPIATIAGIGALASALVAGAALIRAKSGKPHNSTRVL